MKKLFSIALLSGIMLMVQPSLRAQTENEEGWNEEENVEMVDSNAEASADSNAVEEVVEEEAPAVEEEPEKEETPAVAEASNDEGGFTQIHQEVKDKFIEGGVGFMSIVLICLILGLAVSIERIIALNLATTNTKKLLSGTQDALRAGGVDAAREVCASTPGPVASIFSQGLVRVSEGAESVEKSILAYGAVEMGKLEKGLIWIALFISLAPMFGFMGTVIGMIDAFTEIQEAKTIEIDKIARGIKTALLTTVAGLVVAVILQVFYNYCVSKIDSIVNDMDEASILFVDMLIGEEVLNDQA